MAVHPLAFSAVTVYVPGALTDGLARVLENPLGPVHPMIVPLVEAESSTLGVLQVIVPP